MSGTGAHSRNGARQVFTSAVGQGRFFIELVRRQGHLLCVLAGREVADRFTGSLLGKIWALAHPLFLVSLFVCVFTFIFGMRFAASPRHCDVLLVTGPVTRNMQVALERTYAATPDPKWVVAVGDCAAGCGVFEGSYAVVGAVSKVVPVDLHIRGCPPKPIDLLRGLIALMEKATAR